MDSTDTHAPAPIDIQQFKKIIVDFVNDLSIPFPEYSHLWIQWVNAPEPALAELLKYIQSVYPERIFDILYENNEIFLPDSQMNTFFLPNVDFKILFNATGVSETTKTSIWKYLQLVLFTVIGSIYDKDQFGNASQMFEGIDSEELNAKLTESFESLSSFFKKMDQENPDDGSQGNDTTPNIPEPNDMHEHIQKLFDGKIGRLANEMAHELEGQMSTLFPGMETPNSSKDLIKLFMKNPSKIMEISKLVLNKLNQKMKDGDISEEELKKETSEIFKGMKSSKEFKGMFDAMSKTMGLGKNAKMNSGMVDKMIQKEKMKDRLNKKRETKQSENGASIEQIQPGHYVFKGTEKQEKSILPTPEEVMKELDLTNDIIAQPKQQSSGKKKAKSKGKSDNKKTK